MEHLRHLHLLIAALLLSSAHAQLTLCPGEPVQFELEDVYHGDKTWEFSADGVNWETIQVVEDTPFTPQPGEGGWYRVRFYDVDCDSNYLSAPQRVEVPGFDLGEQVIVHVGGRVLDELGDPVVGAVVRSGCGPAVQSTVTDAFGVFLLEDVTAHALLAYVTVEKPGYFPGSRSFIPGENASDAISHVRITLLARNEAGVVDGVAGGQVQLEGVAIDFPANAFVQQGVPYTGPVHVAMNHIDPTGPELHEEMPGMLLGAMDGMPQLMLSYGMVGVELTDAPGQQVELAPGVMATLRYPLMAGQQTDAPPTIPLWWFDEVFGHWVHEGEAQLVGDEYVGEVSHFSWWNIDVSSNFVQLSATVIDINTGVPLPNVLVRVGTESMGDGLVWTNSLGSFSRPVPNGQVLTISVLMQCDPLGAVELVHQEPLGPLFSMFSTTINVDLLSTVITGAVVDCDNEPVSTGYVMSNGNVHYCVDGLFTVVSCGSSASLIGVNLDNYLVSNELLVTLTGDTLNVGELLACNSTGIVFDADGNFYPTVVIGDQEWMAENLRTTSYANGDPIPNVTSNGQWGDLLTGAWSYFDNQVFYDALYGKLYNWYAVGDPRNVCPSGWHVPTEVDWWELETTLDMPVDELAITGYRGGAENVGGKLRTTGTLTAGTGLWSQPNSSATNESGFSGLPGGYRVYGQPMFTGLNNMGRWWSLDGNDQNAYTRNLNYNSPSVYRDLQPKRHGHSVRCVRD
jgi:uncharacterized protein (TIGR02145 family)